jgi:hypothetical protein
MLPRDSDRVQRNKLCRFTPGVDVKRRADASNEFRFAASGLKHAGETEQISSLNRVDINPEGLRWRWKRDAQFRQALLPLTDLEISIGLCAFEDVIGRSHHHR